jgi:hypothetical protein
MLSFEIPVPSSGPRRRSSSPASTSGRTVLYGIYNVIS